VKERWSAVTNVLRTSKKTGGHKMNDIIKKIEEEQLKENVCDFCVGDTVRVHGKIKEGNRERIQIFEGIVIKIQGSSNRATFTVRKSSNGVGVEKTWPLHSPNVEKVEVVRRGKVRRAKLFYLRDRVGKKAKVKELVK
jgi:large subunit ribosomal protein L19